jgi:hypothetical protein
MKRKLSRTWIVLTLALAFTGCGTPPPPTKWFVRRGPTYQTTMPSVERIGVMVDAAIAYDQVDTNFFVIEDSLVAISNIIREATGDLKRKGYALAFVESPFIGTMKPASIEFPVARSRRDKPDRRPPPFQIAEELSADADYRDALLKSLREIMVSVDNRGELPTDQLRSDPATSAALAAVAKKRGIRYLFVVHGSGTVVSGGKQTGQAIGTALLTGVITLGNAVVIAHNVSTLDSFASLVDLENAEIVWCNSIRLPAMNPANGAAYKERWAQNVLYWLPPRGQLEPPLPK